MATVATAMTPARTRRREPEWLVWVTVGIALIIGVLIMWSVVNQTQTGTSGATTVQYPASWVQTTQPGAAFAAADLNNGGPFGARIAVREVETGTLTSRGGGLVDAATNWSLRAGKNLVGFRVLSISPLFKLQGHDAVNVESAYLMEAAQGGTGAGLPGLMHAVDTMVLAGGKYLILTFAAEQSQYPQLSDLHDKLLADWKLPQ